MPCKRLAFELHETKLPFVLRTEFIHSKLSNFSADVSGMIVSHFSKLSGVKELTVFPNLNGTGQLLDLRIYGSRLTAVPDDLCSIAPRLRRM